MMFEGTRQLRICKLRFEEGGRPRPPFLGDRASSTQLRAVGGKLLNSSHTGVWSKQAEQLLESAGLCSTQRHRLF